MVNVRLGSDDKVVVTGVEFGPNGNADEVCRPFEQFLDKVFGTDPETRAKTKEVVNRAKEFMLNNADNPGRLM